MRQHCDTQAETPNDAKIEYSLGSVCLAALRDPYTIEICLNPDGKLWVETLKAPFKKAGVIEQGLARAALNIIAKRLDISLTSENPKVEGELELVGKRFRFAGQIPPIVARPTFAIRVPASRVFTLEEYVGSGIMSAQQKRIISELVEKRRNILVIGGTGSGKTTLLNGIIAEMVGQYPNERILIFEDTGEVSPGKSVSGLRKRLGAGVPLRKAAMLDRVPLHRFSFRPNLVMGCDRELIMFSGLMAFSLAFTALSLIAAVYGGILWTGSLFLLRLMAKADPKMRHVYLRHIRYKRYYPARSTPFRVNTRAYC